MNAIDLSGHAGMQEMVVSVKYLDRAVDLYRDVGGWQILSRSEIAPELSAFWQVAGVQGEQVVLGNPADQIGLLRLVKFHGVDQVRIRSSARAFDTGGIFNLNMLVKDIRPVFERLHDHGCQGFSDPSIFAIGEQRYGGAILRCHDDIVINLIERVGSDYADKSPFEVMSSISNATMIVKDFEEARRFVVDQLGWQQRFDVPVSWEDDGSNNFGLPQSLIKSGQVSARAGSYFMDSLATGGTMEILAFDGIEGVDHSANAHPPHRGILMYGIHVEDLTSYLAQIAERGVDVQEDLTEFDLPPYGRAQGAIVHSPSNAWIMVFEQLKIPTANRMQQNSEGR